MTADLINLRQARKARARDAKAAEAAENRAKFGRTKAERQTSAASEDLNRRRLDAHRRESEPAVDEPSPPGPPEKPQ